ncbi:hypothetical protein DUNSADRAFT_2625 [Dunaliella salina]|uniref:Encoded protein n=1 Tax=Dunaliella salina TaxID=3046 RepID=A0ABQ7GVF1_DUNSA|nr:hypothetical protein DUNSADRAFT_2625 [Dunaliella salina]|eukprot:KAF5838564.1 hypothetical protein DUNSADRAFT_2625 [Dunaliella salina]
MKDKEVRGPSNAASASANDNNLLAFVGLSVCMQKQACQVRREILHKHASMTLEGAKGAGTASLLLTRLNFLSQLGIPVST